MQSSFKTEYFPALTGVRAGAAYMVFLQHFNPFRQDQNSWAYLFCNELYVGVTFFFVLSGFLIAYRYMLLERKEIKTYFVNRIARIYPIFIILTTLTFAFDFIYTIPIDSENLRIYLLNITFIKGFFDGLKFSGIAQGWSLTVEEMFYFIAPLIFFMLRRSIANLILVPTLSIGIGLLLVTIFQQRTKYGFFDNYNFMFNYTFFGRSIEFCAGIALAIIYRQKMLVIDKRFLTYSGLFIICVSILTLSIIKDDYNLGFQHPLGKVINSIVLPVFGITMFYLGLLREDTIISYILKSKLMLILGKSSYVFYLIHLGIFSSLIYNYTHNYFLIFIILNIFSILIYKHFEQPLNKMIRKAF